MKVAIITQPLINNYGGLLQNYALQETLKRLGHEPITVDWDGRFTLKEKVWRFSKQMKGLINKTASDSIKYIPNKSEDIIISENTNKFISKYIVHTKKAFSESSLNREAKRVGAQAFVVGSDQVWRSGYNAFPYAMFLDFTQNLKVRRVAYAASFGSDKWSFKPEQTDVLQKLAKRFDLITVRERSGIDLCKHYLGVDAKHVLDPTMLLNREDYEKLVITEKEPESQGDLFHYILDPNADKGALISSISKKYGLKPFTIMPKYQAENRTKYDVKNHIEDCVFPSVTNWLRGFMDAKMVIVDSFHGAVFSIIFNKPFWVIGNKGRGNARFDSLLGTFNLRERFIEDPGSSDLCLDVSIDWDIVNNIREAEKRKSLALLKEGLD